MKARYRHTVYAAALAALVTGASGALAQEKTFELKLSHWVPASHPLQKALEEWGAAVEKDSGGTIKSKVYPAQQLGNGSLRWADFHALDVFGNNDFLGTGVKSARRMHEGQAELDVLHLLFGVFAVPGVQPHRAAGGI